MSTRIKVNAFFPFCRVKITDQRVNNQLDQVLIKIEPNQIVETGLKIWDL